MTVPFHSFCAISKQLHALVRTTLYTPTETENIMYITSNEDIMVSRNPISLSLLFEL